ncbi:MAG: extracellular solute-binding protein [Chloroflexi bacterium]|nr:extracellular solute-binding protein [Chloroflexota bacterium]
MNGKRLLIVWLALMMLTLGVSLATAQDTQDVSIVHYYSSALGQESMTALFDSFMAANPQYRVVDNSAGHEDFKTQILVTIAGDNPPDLFSYWAGARTQFIVDAERLMPLTDFWNENSLDDIIPAGVRSAAVYNGEIYNIPMNVHVVGFFYNPEVMANAGITEMPTDWEGFLAMCDAILASGVAPIALGSMNRWPAQFWFDYMVSYTAGAEFRQQLMAGEVAYNSPEVIAAMETWKSLVDAGYFVADANAYDWTDAADQVANGEAAMTLMGTFITGYWNGNGLVPGEDYDFFPFPVINPELPVVTHGTVDGWAIPAAAANPEGAQALILHMLSPESQALWAQGQGALAAVNNVDTSIYSPVMQAAADYLAQVEFLSGYDLSTTPPMAEGGLTMFAQFMNDPAGYLTYLDEVEAVAVEVFEK